MQIQRHIGRRTARSVTEVRQQLTKSVTISQSTLSNAKKILIRRRLLILITAGILAAPPLLAIALRGKQLFQYDGDTRAPDEKIAALLHGEQLVPPPPLPPEVFATQEVEQVRPALKDASRDWNLLDADFRTRLLLVYKIMREQYGYEMALLEGYRSPARQDRLAQLGASRMRPDIRAITNMALPPITPFYETASSSFRKKTRGPCAAISCTGKQPSKSA